MNAKLISNVESVRQRIADAAKRSGRTTADVRLIGVSKYVDVETTRAIVEAGCGELGESRPQVLWEKSAALKDLALKWHMIGHLQRNKVKRTVAVADLIHSADSQRLLASINDAALEHQKVMNVLLEVNVSGESAKHGFSVDELDLAIEFAAGFEHVAVKGLMCMAGLAGDVDDARREFGLLRQLAEARQTGLPSNVTMDELSMGMSRDFEIAIENGATMVRVGSLLFEGT